VLLVCCQVNCNQFFLFLYTVLKTKYIFSYRVLKTKKGGENSWFVFKGYKTNVELKRDGRYIYKNNDCTRTQHCSTFLHRNWFSKNGEGKKKRKKKREVMIHSSMSIILLHEWSITCATVLIGYAIICSCMHCLPYTLLYMTISKFNNSNEITNHKRTGFHLQCLVFSRTWIMLVVLYVLKLT